MRKLIGGILLGAEATYGAYLAIWVCIVGGIVDIIDGAKETPTDGGQIFWGLVKVILGWEVVGVITVLVMILTGAALYGWSKTKSKLPWSKRSRQTKNEDVTE